MMERNKSSQAYIIIPLLIYSSNSDGSKELMIGLFKKTYTITWKITKQSKKQKS